MTIGTNWERRAALIMLKNRNGPTFAARAQHANSLPWQNALRDAHDIATQNPMPPALTTSAPAAERALLIAAAHCQGGHSDAGAAIAEVFGIPFPVTMQALEGAATARGYEPKELWPWLFKMRNEGTAA